ncbi:transposase domain-containing protein [Dyadobacter luteus]|uniref:transposase domain-containing protein n=1 Tax=Dyadobacter luteus TaxID=2259619 RepID=UPI0035B5F0C9
MSNVRDKHWVCALAVFYSVALPSLFAGSHQAAEMTAAMYSFMATCKKNGVDEQQWLTDVFERIQSHKQKDLYQLPPNKCSNVKAIKNNMVNISELY